MKKAKKKITSEERQAFVSLGRSGGLALFKRVGKKGMSKLGKKAASIRWANHKKAVK